MEQVVTRENFESIVNNPAVMVDFWAGWCTPCLRIAPFVEELAKEYEGRVVVAKCDIEENDELAETLQIMSIPTLLFFKNGTLVDKVIGVVPKETLKEKIEAMLK